MHPRIQVLSRARADAFAEAGHPLVLYEASLLIDRAPSSTRTTRSSDGSPTAAVTGSSVAPARPPPRPGLGYDHFEVIVDDRSRVAYVAHVANESGRSAAGRPCRAAAVFAAERDPDRAGPDRQRLGLTPSRLRAGPAIGAATSAPGPSAPDQRQGRAVHPDPARPRVGLRTAVPDQRRTDRRLPAWVEFNAERTHTALGGITPMAALVNNLRGNHT